MTAQSQEFRRHVNDLWKQAVDQLDDVKGVIVRSTERFELEGRVRKLRWERDRLLRRLGEQTYRLANQGTLPVPDFVRRTINRLHEVIEDIVEQEQQRERAPGATGVPAATGKAPNAGQPVAAKSHAPGAKPTAPATAPSRAEAKPRTNAAETAKAKAKAESKATAKAKANTRASSDKTPPAKRTPSKLQGSKKSASRTTAAKKKVAKKAPTMKKTGTPSRKKAGSTKKKTTRRKNPST